MIRAVVVGVSLGLATAFPAISLAADTQDAAVTIPASGPVKVESYYRVRWGKKDEFVDLYKRNHLPIMEALMANGLIRNVAIEYPVSHMGGEGAWDVRVTTVWRDSLAAWWQSDLPQWKAAKERLYPDAEAHSAAEQARMQLLDNHWDVVVYADE